MKHTIIGTAGHVDHGKTALIRALTHIETDRLKEEQTRGISIEIGFAYFDLPSGRRAGIIDVPGHERFIKNMLAGIGGIDLALLVVAADEGVMPQTEEHLNILSLLHIDTGLIVLTKKDLVDDEWLELVRAEVRERVQGTFLEDAEMYAVSSVTGDGLPELTAAIDRLTETGQSRDEHAPIRLPVDRVFTVSGFGTVVTGTLVSGTLKVGDRLHILPLGVEARVRTVQVHGERVEQAYAGQRTAVNLAGIDQDQVQRGDVLALPGTLSGTLMIDARLRVLPTAPRALEHRTRVRLYSGAAEVMARIVPLEQETLLPGENGLVQLRLEEPIALGRGDVFILRSYSPMTTIAGGTVIDAAPRKKTRFRLQQVAELKLREQGDPVEQAQQILLSLSDSVPDRSKFAQAIAHLPEAEELIEELLHSELAVTLQADKEYILASDWLHTKGEQAQEMLHRYHQANPLKAGMAREELRSRLLKLVGNRLFGAMVLLWESEGLLQQSGQVIAHGDFTLTLNVQQQRVYDEILSTFEAQLFTPPALTDLNERYAKEKDWQALFELLQLHGHIVKLNEDIYFHKEAMETAEQRLYAFFETQEELSLADFRDILSTSRKFALALLEYFDETKLTMRRGEKRILRKVRRSN